MPLPRPEIGLIVHYGFVWSGPDRGPPPDAGKDRPCLIVDLLQSGTKNARFPVLVTIAQAHDCDKGTTEDGACGAQMDRAGSGRTYRSP
jgi:hypothetical protein